LSEWWTRSQRIRTAGEIPFKAVLFEAQQRPIYLQIADQAAELRVLGLGIPKIAEALGVTDKTVSKALLAHARLRKKGI
jgi:hypothetical protein